MTQVSIDHAARLIGVSTATIRNWVKAGHLSPVKSRPVVFQEADVVRLKNQISTGQLTRLRSRANKTASTVRPAMKASADCSYSTYVAKEILALTNKFQLEVSAVMYFCALRLLVLSNEANLNSSSITLSHQAFSTKREATSHCMNEWRKSLDGIDGNNAYEAIYSAITHADDDILGNIYQTLTHEGDKSHKGAYYTPMVVIDDALKSIDLTAKSFADHCCGSGRYLIKAARILNLPITAIYGFDTDIVATQIAKINVLLAFPQADIAPNIFCLDSIADLANGELHCPTNQLLGNICSIATNPPWGAYKNTTKNNLSKNISSNESFSLLLEKALFMLRTDGCLSFILPESILKTKAHQDVRQLILRTSRIARIVRLGRPFQDVFTNVIRLDLIKGKAAPDWMVSIQSADKVSEVRQADFVVTDDFAFTVDIESADDVILKKLYSAPHTTLKGNADWALGIVTGNNEKFVSDLPLSGMEPVFRGSDVNNFRLREPTSFLNFTPKDFQQVAKEHLYRAPAKLIYKFISSKLSFAYDNKQCLTLNSANILIPKINGHSIKTALAFLNSDVFQYIFKKKFATHKVLRSDLETLPFPVITKDVGKKIEALVDFVLTTGDGHAQLQDVIFTLFNLTESEIFIIRTATRS